MEVSIETSMINQISNWLDSVIPLEYKIHVVIQQLLKHFPFILCWITIIFFVMKTLLDLAQEKTVGIKNHWSQPKPKTGHLCSKVSSLLIAIVSHCSSETILPNLRLGVSLYSIGLRHLKYWGSIWQLSNWK